VGIAASTGGPIALVPVLAGLRGIGVPIVVVQHIPPEFVPVLCGNLTREAGVPVRPADDGGTLRPGDVVVSRGGVHVEVHRGRMGLETRYVDGPPEVGCKPAANVMFRSAANATQGNMVGVCLTGMGTDGAAGLEVLARLGGDVVVQDAATSLVYGMPRAVMATGIHAAQLPLHDMAGAVVRRVRGRTDDGCTANRSG
jgi:two-component system chemotaxis response regulator CheB